MEHPPNKTDIYATGRRPSTDLVLELEIFQGIREIPRYTPQFEGQCIARCFVEI